MPARAAVLVVIGSVRSAAGEPLRITAQLIDGASGCYLWSRVDRRITEADPLGNRSRWRRPCRPSCEREFAATGTSGTPPPKRTWPRTTCICRGATTSNQRTEEGLRKAVEFFEKALAEDARIRAAHSGLADAYGLLAHYGVLGTGGRLDARPRQRGAAAVMLDDHSAEAHTSLAHVKATQDWDWTGAEREFQRAIALEPALRDRASLVRDVVPGAAGPARRGAG